MQERMKTDGLLIQIAITISEQATQTSGLANYA